MPENMKLLTRTLERFNNLFNYFHGNSYDPLVRSELNKIQKLLNEINGVQDGSMDNISDETGENGEA